MSRLLVDGRVLETGASGVRDVARGLVEALRERAQRDGHEVVVAGMTERSGLRLGARGFMEVRLPLAAARGRFDTILVPRQTRPPISTVRCVPLVHDVGFERLRQVYRPTARVRLTNRAALGSHRVLAVSAFTARELRELGRRSPVTVLPLAAMHAIRWRPSHHDPYVLCTAVQEPHKNLVRLVDAWARADTDGFRLVICGRRGRASEDLRAAITHHGLAQRVQVVSGLSDDEYSALLEQCWAYIQPSLYEGLCIPALDMAAAGVPTGVSSSANLGAVFGRCLEPQTFDPHSTDALADALDSVMHDAAHRDRVGRWNAENVRLTDWGAVADAAWGVLA